MKTIRSLDLALAALLAILCMLIIRAGVTVPAIRAIAGLLLVLILPGYVLFAALLPSRPVDSAESLLIMTGSSIVIAILMGLCLALLHQKLEAKVWALALGLFTLLGCLVAVLRRRGSYLPIHAPVFAHLKWQPLVLLLAAVFLAAGAVRLASGPITNPANLQGYTMLWILPSGSAAPGAIRVGVVSNEFTPTSYNLVLEANGQIQNVWKNIELAPGASWEGTYQESANSMPLPIQVFLYKSDNPNVIYRQVKLSSAQ